MQQTKVEEAAARIQRILNGEYQLDVYCPREKGAQWTEHALKISTDLRKADEEVLAVEFVHRCAANKEEREAALNKARELMLKIVEVEGCDRGVIYLSNDGPTHYDKEAKCQVYDHENFSPLGDALIELWEVISKPALASVPQWIKGPPNAPGLWLVICSTGDRAAWLVTEDQDEEDSPKYLRFDDNDTSEPIAGYPWPPQSSFGPIDCSAVVKASRKEKEDGGATE